MRPGSSRHLWAGFCLRGGRLLSALSAPLRKALQAVACTRGSGQEEEPRREVAGAFTDALVAAPHSPGPGAGAWSRDSLVPGEVSRDVTHSSPDVTGELPPGGRQQPGYPALSENSAGQNPLWTHREAGEAARTSGLPVTAAYRGSS